MIKLVLAALALAAGAPGNAAVAPAMVTASNPETIRALMTRWGYRPESMERSADGIPNFEMTVGEIATVVAFGGCTDGRNCTYIVLVANYTDVVNPPFEWLNARNNDYDLATVSRSELGILSIRTGIMLGTQGIPEALFHDQLLDWVTTCQSIASEALDAHLVTPESPGSIARLDWPG